MTNIKGQIECYAPFIYGGAPCGAAENRAALRQSYPQDAARQHRDAAIAALRRKAVPHKLIGYLVCCRLIVV
jgi:hypothetical protein